MAWNPALNDLINLLADLYPDRGRAELVALNIGLNLANLDLSGAPRVFWLRIVQEARNSNKIQNLIEFVKQDCPNIALEVLEQQLRQGRVLPTPKDFLKWKGPKTAVGNLERVIGKQPTFLPISFLEDGLFRARSVAWLGPKSGFGPVGTGFLIGKDLLITANHVIPTASDAEEFVARFNYQKTRTGAEAQAAEYDLDPARTFEADEAHDWTAVAVKGDPGSTWGWLDLATDPLPVKIDDFVNIIQHPAGLPKQIALYHNVVAYVDDRRVQYLTDTMPGSSGAPVFNKDWKVVALHQLGGWLNEPGTDKVYFPKVYFRNEGLHVGPLLNGLRKKGLL